jgi:hypothetical protein
MGEVLGSIPQHGKNKNKNKTDFVVHIYNLSYSGGSRRI